ncbi:outer membrane protein assembly factor BamB family protein [Rhodococcoides fascians]|uniref:outer membrane protein assembly factor BamB family protein n=1 Tax=Rhodococcoides fascians TaxID=1828 RepID=UPI001E337223|nr:PQQ-binding-like beta-propeller repeat protein [Rhodococcus fascians]
MRSSDGDGPVAGQLTNTYPSQPQQGWRLAVDDVLPGGDFLSPDSLVATYGVAEFIEIGSTLVTTVGTGPGQQTEVVAVDAATGAVKWHTPADGTITCATAAVNNTLPCVVRSRDTQTATVQFFDMSSGKVTSRVDRPDASMVEVYDGSVFTVDSDQEMLTINRGTSRDLTAQWSITESWETDCVGSGDAHYFDISEGIVHFTNVRTIVLDAADGRLLSDPNLGGFERLPGQGFAGVRCEMRSTDNGDTSIVTDFEGKEKFRLEHESPAEPWLVSASPDRPFVGSHGAYRIDDGSPLWTVDGGEYFSLKKVIGDIVLGSDRDTLSAYRIDTGEELWSTRVTGSDLVGSDGERVLLRTEGGLETIDLADGTTSWFLEGQTDYASWGKSDEGLASVTNSELTYYPPTGGASTIPGQLPELGSGGDGEDQFVTKCGSTPVLTPVEYRTQAEGLVVRMEMKASCPGGDIVSTNAMRVSITDNTASVASAVFDFSDSPIYLPRTDRTNSTNTVERDFLYELDSFWRLPNSLGSSSSLTDAKASGTQLVECEDEGTSDSSLTSGAPSQPRTNTPITAVRSAAPTTADVETTSLDALRAQANADLPFVQGDLADRWVAQISAKRTGLDAADINGAPVRWTAEQILRQHLQLRLMYPEVRLLWSDEWRTFDLRGWWVTVAGLTFGDADAANGWCDSKKIAIDQCFAKIVSNSRGSSGTTKYRR